MKSGLHPATGGLALRGRALLGGLLVALAILGGTFALHAALERRFSAEVDAAVAAQLDNTRDQVAAELRSRALLIRRLARLFGRQGLSALGSQDTAAIVEDDPTFWAIGILDPEGRVIGLTPTPRADPSYLGARVGVVPELAAVLDEAGRTSDLVFGSSFAAGGDLLVPLAVAVPGPDGATAAFVIAGLDVRALFAAVTGGGQSSDYAIALTDGAVRLQLAGARGATIHQTRLDWHGLHWTLEVSPTPELIAARRGPLPRTVTSVGIAVALLAGLAVYLGLVGRRRARTLAETMTLQDAIFAGADYGIVSTDLSGVIRSLNPAAERLTGRRADEWIGLRTLDRLCCAGEVLERRRMRGLPSPVAAVLGRAADGKVEEREWTCVRKDGTRFPIRLSITPMVDAAGRRTGYLAIASDVTLARLESDALRSARDAAERAAKVKTEFLARMSHEIRTPLNGAIGMTELALGTELTAEQREYLDTAKSSARALMSIIDDVLDFSRLDAGQLQFERRPFRLRDGVGDVVRTLAARAHERGLELMLAVDTALPDRLVGDFGRVRQVLLNLLGNALKFTEKGEIVVRAEREPSADGEVRVRFTVADTGIGIPLDQQAQIFDPFVQADASISRRYGGTGLGLAISAQLVRQMGGRIWVESAPGEGSRFHFTVHFQREAVVADPTGPVVTALIEVPVLIADDNEHQRAILVELALGHWMVPRAVATADDALELLAHPGEVALVIADAELPNGGSERLAEALRSVPALAATRVLWLTAPGAPLGSLDVPGRTGRLNKPVVLSALGEALLRLVSGPVARPSPAPAPASLTGRLRLLLADDNTVNRTVAARLLERAGHEVVTVSDGAEALSAIERQRFDAVLMDVQMPVLDGLSTTRLVRALETETGGHLPIVAITAQAMNGDAERCLEAGMDAYVPKPLVPEQLFATLARVVGPKPVVPASAPPVDPSRLATLTGNSPELLREVVGIFLEDLPRMVDEVAAAASDAPRLMRSAHKLKGALLNVACHPASEQARALEQLAHTGDLSRAPQTVLALQAEVARAQATLRELV